MTASVPSSSAHPQISVSVMAHPKRSAQAHALATELAGLPTRVVFDPDPTGAPSSVRVAALAWRPWDDTATHHLVVQDDVLLHSQFTSQLRDAVRSQPDAALSFFSEWGSFTSHALRMAAFTGASWVRQPDTYLATVAMVLPASHAHGFADLLAHSDTDLPDDHAAFQYVRSRDLHHYVSNPNLVEHDHLPSLVGNTGQGLRRATCFVPGAVAPPSWWTKQPLEDFTAVPAVHWTTGTPSSYEASSDSSAQWVIRRRRELWRGAHSTISSLIRKEAAPLLAASEDMRLSAAVLDAASILCDQLAFAAPSALSNDTFAIACATEAARTLAPGSLRGLANELGGNVDSEQIRDMFARLASQARVVFDATSEAPRNE